ncbi:MAG: hypothetical protein F6K54_02065 [Okeania sp. SIO3B5]|nr:hypothetical protein [Okeania sp. SIO3B5]
MLSNRTKKTVENCNSLYLDIGLTNTGALGAAHYSLGSKCPWEFLILYLKTAINIGINNYTSSTPFGNRV